VALALSTGDDPSPRVARASTPARTTTTPTPTVPTTPAPTSTVPAPPLNPRHIIRRSSVGAARPLFDDGILFRVESVRQVASIPHDRYSDPIEGSRRKRLIRADIVYVNRTREPVDVFCGGYAARLLDSAGHRIEPLKSYLDVRGNDVCGADKVGLNETSHVVLGFKIPRERGVRGIFLLNAKAADYNGADTKTFFALR
jgi:hypothetical protein